MTPHSLSVTDECGVCGGPCREPYKQGPVHESYPFMTPEQIKMTQQLAEPQPDPDAEVEPPARGKRSHRLREDRAHRPAEDRAT